MSEAALDIDLWLSDRAEELRNANHADATGRLRIGEVLAEVRDRLARHGSRNGFSAWVERSLPWCLGTVYRYIGVWEMFGGKDVRGLSYASMSTLSSMGASADVVEEALALNRATGLPRGESLRQWVLERRDAPPVGRWIDRRPGAELSVADAVALVVEGSATPAEAARRCKVNRGTIYKRLKNGAKTSPGRSGRARKVDLSELAEQAEARAAAAEAELEEAEARIVRLLESNRRLKAENKRLREQALGLREQLVAARQGATA